MPDLQLPDDTELLAHSVLIQGLEGHLVLKTGRGGGGLIRRAAGQPLHDDVGGGPGGTADLDHLAGLRQRGCLER